MKRAWTIIGVSDVPRSFKWYQSLFGHPATSPSHPYFGQILDTDGTVLLCLHQWGAHEHPSLMSPDEASPGNGLLLFFRVDDYDKTLNRARALVARFEEEPHVNPNTPNKRVLTPGRILRHDQRALCALGKFVASLNERQPSTNTRITHDDNNRTLLRRMRLRRDSL